MRISLLQFNPEWENKDKNFENLRRIIYRDYSPADLLIMPEMTFTGFTMNARSMAEAIPGRTTEVLSALAFELNTNIIAGVIENNDGKYYNSLVHINMEGEVAAIYRKIHPFSFSDEEKYYSGGTAPVTAQTGGWKAGLSVCYDLRFPELFRLYGKEEIPLIINIANWPASRMEHYHALLKARAIENLCYAVGVNRTGTDPIAEYNGNSVIFDPWGNGILFAPPDEGIFSADISLDYVREIRAKYSFLKDIRLI